MEIGKTFGERLLEWYRDNGRSYYPWRNTSDPYRILVAEIMLQRTKADQVVPLYLSFLEKFPSIEILTEGSEEEINKYFAHLGLRWRADRILRMAHEIATKFDGKLLGNRKELLSIPGIGEYIADAILVFAYGERRAILDANICRIIERVFSLAPRGEARRNPEFRRMADRLLPRRGAREYNFAMIDLASLVCLPRNPKCNICPLGDICEKSMENAMICSP